MQNQKKCSEHSEVDAIIYCPNCNIYMCNKCEQFHKGLFKSHQTHNLKADEDDIFTGFCKEKNHYNKLEFFCKTHNQLCCANCITKIKVDNYGNHSNCQVCSVVDIKEEKKTI